LHYINTTSRKIYVIITIIYLGSGKFLRTFYNYDRKSKKLGMPEVIRISYIAQ